MPYVIKSVNNNLCLFENSLKQLKMNLTFFSSPINKNVNFHKRG